METNKPAPPAHPVELAILAALATARAVVVLGAALLALVLALAGWKPAAAPVVAAAPYVAPLGDMAAQLDALNVANLRALARSRGLRSLARSGRRAQLLAALVEA